MISEKIKNIKDVYKYGYDDIAKDLFATCLKECNKFRRTTGSFKTTAFQSYIEALENILTNENIRIEILCDNNQIEGQLLRILKKTLSKKDKDRIISEYFNKELLIAVGYKDSVDNQDNNKERFYRKQLLAWLIATNKLEIRFATPKDLNKLIEVEEENSLEDKPFVNNEGMYHSKNGYFQFSGEDEYLVFTGSGNESITGHKKSDETFSVFKSWEGSTHSKIHKEYIDQDWTGTNPHIAVYKTEKETLDKINVIAPKNFPKKPKIETEPSPESKPELITDEYKYRHQSEAVNIFLEKRNGILEMATGTGKTNTALKIINELKQQRKIDFFIVTCYGVDLLSQWKEVLFDPKNKMASKVMDNFGRIYFGKEDRQSFTIDPIDAGLLVSIDDIHNALIKLDKDNKLTKGLIIYDEVHNLGTERRIKKISEVSQKIIYKLGLSATPDKGEFGEDMTKAIEENIGDVIYKFDLELAIKRGILCEFDYVPLNYSLGEEDFLRRKRILGQIKKRKEEKNPMTEMEQRIALSKVYKLCENKLVAFEDFVGKNPDILESTIIFVEDSFFGEKVLDILQKYTNSYRTYYGGYDINILKDFIKESIGVLVTCEAISQGIDIPNLKNIVIFSSNKSSRGQTIQRIGRCLRNPKSTIKKIAKVIDFFEVRDDSKESYDQERYDWLKDLSKIKFEKENSFVK